MPVLGRWWYCRHVGNFSVLSEVLQEVQKVQVVKFVYIWWPRDLQVLNNSQATLLQALAASLAASRRLVS